MNGVLDIIDGKAELPCTFKKMKKIDIIANFKSNISTGLPMYQNWTEQVTKRPADNVPLYTPMGCVNDCGKCYWVIPHKETIEQSLIFTEHIPLNHCNSHTLGKHDYSIDKEESVINFGINSGKAIICYYSDMDKIGLIPKEPKLYFYYEWSVKLKILQDIYMNSEDDVIGKIQMAKQELMGAYIDFDNYIKSESFKKSLQRQKNFENDFWQT